MGNNPLNAVDPLGLDDCATYDKSCIGNGGAAGGSPIQVQGTTVDVFSTFLAGPYGGDFEPGTTCVDGLCNDANFTFFKQVDASSWQINKFKF